MTLSLREPPIPLSFLTHWDARWKLAALLILGISFSLLNHVLTAGAAALFSLLLTVAARLPGRLIRNRLGLVALSVLPVLVVLPIAGEHGGATWEFGALKISPVGWRIAMTIALRAVAIAGLVLIALHTGPFVDLLAAAHALRFPKVGVQITQLAYRYIFLFFEEVRRLRVAMRTRGYTPRLRFHTYRTLGHAAGSLLVRGGDQAERVADAMRCRGFDGKFHTLQEFTTRTWDVLGLLLALLLAVALVLWDRLE